MKVFECRNDGCGLGGPGRGRFTGGISIEQVTLRTGKPPAVIEEEKIPYGDGVCPNCGKPGKPAGTVTPKEPGTDPHAAHHAAVDARVRDETDPLTPAGAQAALQALIDAEQGGES